MSQFVEFANKVQAQQIDAVKQGQDAFLKVVESFDSVPAVEVPEQVNEILKPAYDVFGTPADVKAFYVDSLKVWNKVSQDFANALVAKVA